MASKQASQRLFTRRFWKSIETKYYLLFSAAVFLTFSVLGYVYDLLNNLQTPYENLVITILISGLFACLYAYAGTKRPILFPFIIIVHFLLVRWNRTAVELKLTPETTETKLIFLSTGIILSIIAGYILFIIFINKVGIKHFLLKAEMDLAKKIHDVLVPRIDKTVMGFEIYGITFPTSEVGGDLEDVIDSEDGLLLLSADVTGHGVAAGMYMGMFKSSIRSLSGYGYTLSDLIRKVNDTLVSLFKKDMFITCSLLELRNNGEANFSIAGHPPILHFISEGKKVEELSIKQIPIGVRAGFEFNSCGVNFHKGDIFALITDGITETRDKDSEEFGLERIKELLIKNSNLSLKDLSGNILSEVSKFGMQRDDITILLVRC